MWAAFRHPVHPENKQNLARVRERVPAKFRTSQQMYGVHGEGCAATIGAMPRCDFACRGCYLGEDANQIPAQGLDAIKAQMRVLRQQVGRWGNLQLTDGEITLRPEEDILELLRYAREIQLLPMLMTHGDTFRRKPGMLERLVRGGLREVSIHVDTTQRGRRGDSYRFAKTEEELHPLRDEFAQMVRDVRRATGKQLRAATTMTVTADNLAGVPTVVDWMVRNADAFCLISFQPVAQVGRTEDGLGAVDVEHLWRQISVGVWGTPDKVHLLDRGVTFLGHPECTRYVTGAVRTTRDGKREYLSTRDFSDDKTDRRVRAFFQRFGGITFRPDRCALEIGARALGMLAHAPLFFARNALPYAWKWLHRVGDGHPWRALGSLLTRRTKLHGLMLSSHHFMSRQQIETPLGRERLDLCIFHLAIDGKIVSMCEANALGVRDQYYAALLPKAPPAPQERELVGSGAGAHRRS
jgi:hypothetical protein